MDEQVLDDAITEWQRVDGAGLGVDDAKAAAEAGVVVLTAEVAGEGGGVAIHVEHEASDVRAPALAPSGDVGKGNEVGWLEGVIVADGHGGSE